MKIQSNIVALKFATAIGTYQLSNYETSMQHMGAELSQGAQEHDTSIYLRLIVLVLPH